MMQGVLLLPLTMDELLVPALLLRDVPVHREHEEGA